MHPLSWHDFRTIGIICVSPMTSYVSYQWRQKCHTKGDRLVNEIMTILPMASWVFYQIHHGLWVVKNLSELCHSDQIGSGWNNLPFPSHLGDISALWWNPYLEVTQIEALDKLCYCKGERNGNIGYFTFFYRLLQTWTQSYKENSRVNLFKYSHWLKMKTKKRDFFQPMRLLKFQCGVYLIWNFLL